MTRITSDDFLPILDNVTDTVRSIHKGAKRFRLGLIVRLNCHRLCVLDYVHC